MSAGEPGWANDFTRATATILNERNNDPADRQVSQFALEWLERNENASELWDLINTFVDNVTDLALEEARKRDPKPWVRYHEELGASGRFGQPFFTGDGKYSFKYEPRETSTNQEAS